MFKPKYKPRAVVHPLLSNEDLPYTWKVKSARTAEEYWIISTPRGFTCDCNGFTYHGKCKHITAVIDRLLDENYPRYHIKVG